MADENPEYLLGGTQSELERLQKQHAWLQMCLNKQIVFAPIDLKKSGLKVLDLGCADGTLLRDLRKELSPSAELVGLDLMAEFLPGSPQGNISYLAADICNPPAQLTGSFDLAHVRYVLLGCTKVSLGQVMDNLVSTLVPGGWLQVQEMDLSGSQAGQPPVMKDIKQIFTSIMNLMGLGFDFVKRLPEEFEKAGLSNVTVKHVELPVGKRFSNEADAKSSLEPFKLTLPAISAAAKGLGADLPPSVYENLAERFEREGMEHGACFTSDIIIGQKPFN